MVKKKCLNVRLRFKPAYRNFVTRKPFHFRMKYDAWRTDKVYEINRKHSQFSERRLKNMFPNVLLVCEYRNGSILYSRWSSLLMSYNHNVFRSLIFYHLCIHLSKKQFISCFLKMPLSRFKLLHQSYIFPEVFQITFFIIAFLEIIYQRYAWDIAQFVTSVVSSSLEVR